MMAQAMAAMALCQCQKRKQRWAQDKLFEQERKKRWEAAEEALREQLLEWERIKRRYRSDVPDYFPDVPDPPTPTTDASSDADLDFPPPPTMNGVVPRRRLRRILRLVRDGGLRPGPEEMDGEPLNEDERRELEEAEIQNQDLRGPELSLSGKIRGKRYIDRAYRRKRRKESLGPNGRDRMKTSRNFYDGKRDWRFSRPLRPRLVHELVEELRRRRGGRLGGCCGTS